MFYRAFAWLVRSAMLSDRVEAPVSWAARVAGGMDSDSREREFEFRAERSLPVIEVLMAVIRMVKEAPVIDGLQEVQPGRAFRLTFKSKEAAAAFRVAVQPTVVIGGVRVSVSFLGADTRILRILRVPLLVPNDQIREALKDFGNILSLHDEEYQQEAVKRYHVRTGVRICRMELAKPVPNLLKIAGTQATVIYPGVVQLCRRCEQPGHVRINCSVPSCTRCFQLGHVEKDCPKPCVSCGGHCPGLKCTQRVKEMNVETVGSAGPIAEAVSPLPLETGLEPTSQNIPIGAEVTIGEAPPGADEVSVDDTSQQAPEVNELEPLTTPKDTPETNTRGVTRPLSPEEDKADSNPDEAEAEDPGLWTRVSRRPGRSSRESGGKEPVRSHSKRSRITVSSSSPKR